MGRRIGKGVGTHRYAWGKGWGGLKKSPRCFRKTSRAFTFLQAARKEIFFAAVKGLFLRTQNEDVSVGQGLVGRVEVDDQVFALAAALEDQRGKVFQGGLETAALEGGVPEFTEGLEGHVFLFMTVDGVLPKVGRLHDFVEADLADAVHLS